MATSHCKRGCGRPVARPGMICNICRKKSARARAGRCSRSRMARGGAAAVLARSISPAVGRPQSVPPRRIVASQVLDRYFRLAGVQEEMLGDRQYADLFSECARRADRLNALLGVGAG